MSRTFPRAVLSLLIPAALLLAAMGGWSAAADATDSAGRGVLEAREVSVVVEVPTEGLWRSPQADFVCPETVVVRDSQGSRLTCVSTDPGKGQYRARLDGCVRFCTEDVGKKVSVRYEYRPHRIAILPPVAGAAYEDALPTMRETLTRELGERGFVVASDDDLADALVRLRSSGAATPQGLAPATVSAVAESMDAAYLLLPGVDANEDSVFAGLHSYTWVTGSSTSARAHTTASAVNLRYMNVAAGITVFDAVLGDVIFERVVEGSKRVRFRQFAPARRALIQELTARIVSEWRGPVP